MRLNGSQFKVERNLIHYGGYLYISGGELWSAGITDFKVKMWTAKEILFMETAYLTCICRIQRIEYL